MEEIARCPSQPATVNVLHGRPGGLTHTVVRDKVATVSDKD